MRRKLAIAVVLLALAAASAWLSGCESTDLTVDPEGEIRVTANPGTVVIDRDTGAIEGTSTIGAQVFDAGGYAMQGVKVYFTTSGGTLASSGAAKETDANGVATDVLTLKLADPATVEVTVSSGSVSQKVSVTKTVSSGNTPPTAILNIDPADGQVRGRQVTFSGLASSDPDGSITCYQWIIDSTVNAQDEVVQGTGSSVFTRTYPVEQFLSVTLRVSDDPQAATTFCAPGAAPAPPSEFSAEVDFVNGYEIACALVPPTANAGTDQTVTAGGAPVNVTLNGTATVTDAAIAGYTWDCGNGTALQNTQNATCTYTNSGTTNITYTAELRVTDACGLTGIDRVNVVVRP